jgi:hypothetical protein
MVGGASHEAAAYEGDGWADGSSPSDGDQVATNPSKPGVGPLSQRGE